MKLIEGQSLSRLIKQKYQEGSGFDPEAAAQLAATVARAVHFAHERGFLHCDLKPSNILLERDGRPYVTDFGLAKRTSEDSELSVSGAILGTPSYMAPEQASGSRRGLSAATDVYGLGAILYELLTGSPPFRCGTVMETVVDVLERDPSPPRELRPGIPKELETICLKCLEKDPKDRYPTAEALAQELERHLQGEVIDTTSLIPRLRRWHRREPELIARLGGLFLVALIAQFNYYVTLTDPKFRLHYTIQGVLALWALSAVLFQMMTRAGWQTDRVRVFWSAADIVFVTIEIRLFEQVERMLPGGHPVVRVVTTLLVGYPILVAASGSLVASVARLADDGHGDAGLLLALPGRGTLVARGQARVQGEPGPRAHHDLPGGPAPDRLRGREAGEANLAIEPVLRAPADRVRF